MQMVVNRDMNNIWFVGDGKSKPTLLDFVDYLVKSCNVLTGFYVVFIDDVGVSGLDVETWAVLNNIRGRALGKDET